MSVRYPPISNIRKKIFGYLMYAGIPFSRPKSVEAEAKKLWWKKWRLTMILAVLIAGGVSSGTIAGAIAKVRGKL
jgi:aldehyde dehydrogenase (NAD+)